MALNEVLHLDTLAKILLSIDEKPMYYGYGEDYHSQFLLSSLPYTNTPKQMLLDDISLKMQMIKTYENSLKKIKLEEIREKILRLKAEEELHLDRLKILLKKYKDGEFDERFN
jgi:rubrerythrin